jgi:hypothetical protein
MEGTIEGVEGSWGSGLATITIRRDDGTTEELAADNGPLVRGLDAMFEGVIGPGHTVNVDALKGKRVSFGRDEMGLLEWVGPA